MGIYRATLKVLSGQKKAQLCGSIFALLIEHKYIMLQVLKYYVILLA